MYQLQLTFMSLLLAVTIVLKKKRHPGLWEYSGSRYFSLRIASKFSKTVKEGLQECNI